MISYLLSVYIHYDSTGSHVKAEPAWCCSHLTGITSCAVQLYCFWGKEGRGGFLKVSEIKLEQMQKGLVAWQANKFAVVKFYRLLTFTHLPSASSQRSELSHNQRETDAVRRQDGSDCSLERLLFFHCSGSVRTRLNAPK